VREEKLMYLRELPSTSHIFRGRVSAPYEPSRYLQSPSERKLGKLFEGQAGSNGQS
jgi:hypothetical protein